MADTAYIITRGFQEGKQLTTTQKTSALFAEEPVVLGRVLRRGSRPMRISQADYNANEHNLLRLEKAEAIHIRRPVSVEEEGLVKVIDEIKKLTGNEPVKVSGAGDTAPSTQESSAAPTAVEPLADPPDVIVPPHPPSEDPPKPPEEPPPAPPTESEAPEGTTVIGAADALASGIPESTTLPMQVKNKERRKRS